MKKQRRARSDFAGRVGEAVRRHRLIAGYLWIAQENSLFAEEAAPLFAEVLDSDGPEEWAYWNRFYEELVRSDALKAGAARATPRPRSSKAAGSA